MEPFTNYSNSCRTTRIYDYHSDVEDTHANRDRGRFSDSDEDCGYRRTPYLQRRQRQSLSGKVMTKVGNTI